MVRVAVPQSVVAVVLVELLVQTETAQVALVVVMAVVAQALSLQPTDQQAQAVQFVLFGQALLAQQGRFHLQTQVIYEL